MSKCYYKIIKNIGYLNISINIMSSVATASNLAKDGATFSCSEEENIDSGYIYVLEESSEGNSDQPDNKTENTERPVNTLNYYYSLAPESDANSDKTESENSIHEKSTDWVKDSSDLTKSSMGSEDENIEYEVVSMSDGEKFYNSGDKCSSSGPDVVPPKITLSSGILDVQIVKDDDSPGERSGFDSDSKYNKKLSSAPYKFCIRCKDVNVHPDFQYCFRCQRLRRDFFPSRPTKKNKNKVKQEYSDSSDDEGIGNSFNYSIDPSSSLCPVCKIRPKDGGFQHGLVIHVCACYKCSIKIMKKSKICLACPLTIKSVKQIKRV